VIVIRNNPTYHFLVAWVRTRLEPLRERSERGASAVEWAIIAAISVAVAGFVGTLIWKKVKGQSDCINSGDTSTTGCGR
jgi:Flp pilus assembly pilin Flp